MRRRSDTPWGRGQSRPDSGLDLETTVTRIEFMMADQDGDNCLDWWEFLNLAAQHVLGRRDEVRGKKNCKKKKSTLSSCRPKLVNRDV